MLRLIKRFPADPTLATPLTLALTADERTRSRHHFSTPEGVAFYLNLPRGTVLHDGDLLHAESKEWVRVVAKPEPVLIVTGTTPLALLRAAYHLGNRHVPLEVNASYLSLSPDPVLKVMLEQLGLIVTEAIQPFQPEAGAYTHSDNSASGHSATAPASSVHNHGHGHDSAHSHGHGHDSAYSHGNSYHHDHSHDPHHNHEAL